MTKSFTSNCGKFQFTVKMEFIQKVYVSDWSVYELMTKYRMMEYLHNPNGPAIINLESGYQEYWLNGKQLTEAEGKKMHHDSIFHSDFNRLLKEEK